MRAIRPLAIGLFRHDGALLGIDARDPVSGARFCRPVGGEIEFGETAAAALVLENRFEYGGTPGHEIVFVFDCAFADPAVYRRRELEVEDEASGERRVARWYSIGSLAAGDPPLYPAGLVELIERLVRGG